MRSGGGKVSRSVTTPSRSTRGSEGSSGGATRAKGGRKLDGRKLDSPTEQVGEEKDDIISDYSGREFAASPSEDCSALEILSQSEVIDQGGGTTGRTRASVLLLPSSSHGPRFLTHAESRHLPSESLNSPTFSSPTSLMSRASSSSSCSLSTAHTTDTYEYSSSAISSRRSHALSSLSSSPAAGGGRQQKKKEDSSSPTELAESLKTADPSQPLSAEPSSSSLSHSPAPSHLSRPPRTRSSTVSTSFNLRSHLKPPVGSQTTSTTPEEPTAYSLSVCPSSLSLPSSDALTTQGEKEPSPQPSGCIDSEPASRGGGSRSAPDGNSSNNPSNSHKKRAGGRGGAGGGTRYKKPTPSLTVKTSPVKAVPLSDTLRVSESSPSLSSSAAPPSLVGSSRSPYETRMRYSSQAVNVPPRCAQSREENDEEISASSRLSRDFPAGSLSQAKTGGGGIVTRSHNKGLATAGGVLGVGGGAVDNLKKDRSSRSSGVQPSSPRSPLSLLSGRSLGMCPSEEGISDASHVQNGEGLQQGKKQEDDSHSTSSSCPQEGGEAIVPGVHTAGDTSALVETGRREKVEAFQRGDRSSRVKHQSVLGSPSGGEGMKDRGEIDGGGSIGRIQEGTAATSLEKDEICTKNEVDGAGMADDVDAAPGSSGVYTPQKGVDTKVMMGKRQEFNLRSRVQRRGGPVKGEELIDLGCHSSVCTPHESGGRVRSKTKEENQIHSNAPSILPSSPAGVCTAEGTGEGGDPLEKAPSIACTAGGRRITIRNSQKKGRISTRSNANSLSSEGEGREEDAVSMSEFSCSSESKEVFQGEPQQQQEQQTPKNSVHQIPSVDTPERKEERGRISHCPSMASSSSSESRSLPPQSLEGESELRMSMIPPSPSSRTSLSLKEASEEHQDVSSEEAPTTEGAAVASPQRRGGGVHTPPQEVDYHACFSSSSQGENSQLSLPKSTETAGVCTPERLLQLPSRLLLQDRRLVAASPSSQSSVGSNLGLDSKHHHQTSPSQSPSRASHFSFFNTPSSSSPPPPAYLISFSHEAGEDKLNPSLSSSSRLSSTPPPNPAAVTTTFRRTRRSSQSPSMPSSSVSSSSVSCSQNSPTSSSLPCSSPSSASSPVLASSTSSSSSSSSSSSLLLLSSSSSSSSSSVASSSSDKDATLQSSSFSPSPLGKPPDEPLSEGETTRGLRRSLRQRQIPYRCQSSSISSSSLVSSPLPSRSLGEGFSPSESAVSLSSSSSPSTCQTNPPDTSSASTRSSHTKSSEFYTPPLLPAASCTGGNGNANRKKVSSSAAVKNSRSLEDNGRGGGGEEEEERNKKLSSSKKEEKPDESHLLGITPPPALFLGSPPDSLATGRSSFSSSSSSLVTPESSSLKNALSPPGEKEHRFSSVESGKRMQVSPSETTETGDAKAPRPSADVVSRRRTEGESLTRDLRGEGEEEGGLQTAVWGCQEIEATTSSSFSSALESSGEGGERGMVSTRKKKHLRTSSLTSSTGRTSSASFSLAAVKTGGGEEEEEGKRGVRREGETFSPPSATKEEEEDRRTMQDSKTIEGRSEKTTNGGGGGGEDTCLGGRMITRAVVVRTRRGGEGEEEKREMSGGGSVGLRRSERREGFLHLPGENASSHESTAKSSSLPVPSTRRESRHPASISSREEKQEDSSSLSKKGGGSEKVASTCVSLDLLSSQRSQGELPKTTPQPKPPTTSTTSPSSSSAISSPSLPAKSTPLLPSAVRQEEGAKSSHSSSSVSTPRSGRRGGGTGGGGGVALHSFNGPSARTPGTSSSSSSLPSHHLPFSHITTRASAAAAASACSSSSSTGGGGGKLQGDANTKTVAGGGGVGNASSKKQKGSAGGSHPSHSHQPHSNSINSSVHQNSSHSQSSRTSSSVPSAASHQVSGGGGGGGRRLTSKASAAAAAALARQQRQQEEGRRLCDLVKFDVSWFTLGEEQDEDEEAEGVEKERAGMEDEKDLESSRLFEPRERMLSLRRRVKGRGGGDEEEEEKEGKNTTVIDWESYWLRPLSPVRRVDMLDRREVPSSSSSFASSYPGEGCESSSVRRNGSKIEQTVSSSLQQRQEDEEKKKKKEKEGCMLLHSQERRSADDKEEAEEEIRRRGRERNDERGEQDGDLLRKKEDLREKANRNEDRCRREDDESVLLVRRRRERQELSHSRRRALLLLPQASFDDLQDRQRKSSSQEKEAGEELDRKKDFLKCLKRHGRSTSRSDEELFIEGGQDLDDDDDDEETLSFAYDDADLEGYLSDVMKAASAVCTPHPCEREGEIKLKVPRCCYCRLPRRIPSYKQSFYQDLEEQLPGFLRLFCVCPARKFGDSCLQGSAGREGLVLPSPSQSLFYSVRSVGRDEEQERREETDLSDLEGDETAEDEENDSQFSDGDRDHRADEDRNEDEKKEEERRNRASSFSSSSSSSSSLPSSSSAGLLSAERSVRNQVCIEGSPIAEREEKSQKSPGARVHVAEGEEEREDGSSSSSFPNLLIEKEPRGEEEGMCLDRKDRSEGTVLDEKTLAQATGGCPHLTSVGKEDRARGKCLLSEEKKEKMSTEKDDEKNKSGRDEQERLKGERKAMKEHEEEEEKQTEVMKANVVGCQEDEARSAKEQQKNEKSTKRTGDDDALEEEKKEEEEKGGRGTVEGEKRAMEEGDQEEEKKRNLPRHHEHRAANPSSSLLVLSPSRSSSPSPLIVGSPSGGSSTRLQKERQGLLSCIDEKSSTAAKSFSSSTVKEKMLFLDGEETPRGVKSSLSQGELREREEGNSKTVEKRTISSSSTSEERMNGEREKASYPGAQISPFSEERQEGEERAASSFRKSRDEEKSHAESHRSASSNDFEEIRETTEKETKRKKREESCLRTTKKRKRRRKELIFRWRDPSTLQCYSSSLDVLQGSISTLSASARIASSISSVAQFHTSPPMNSREKDQREKNIISSSSQAHHSPPVVFLPRLFYEKESDCYIASCLAWKSSDRATKIREKEKKMRKKTKNISSSPSSLTQQTPSSSPTPSFSSSSSGEKNGGLLALRGDEGSPSVRERENTKTCARQVRTEESMKGRRAREEGEEGKERGFGKEEEEKKKTEKARPDEEGEREGRERGSHGDRDRPDGSSGEKIKNPQEDKKNKAEDDDEEEEDEDEVPTGLKLLQKRFSVGFLGHSKAHFYASEWLRWQYEKQQRLLFVSLQQKTTQEEEESSSFFFSSSSRSPPSHLRPHDDNSDLGYHHGSWSSSPSSFPLDVINPANSFRRDPYHQDLGVLPLRGRGGAKAAVSPEAHLLLSSLDHRDDFNEDFYEGRRGDNKNDYYSYYYYETEERYRELLLLLQQQQQVGNSKSTYQGRKGAQVKKGSNGSGVVGNARVNGSSSLSFLKSSPYPHHHQYKHLYPSLHSSSSSCSAHGASSHGTKSSGTTPAATTTRGGGGASKNSAAVHTPEDLSSLTPEELELFRKRQETRERQKKQKLLRQQWRRQQAREAKLRMLQQKEQEQAQQQQGADRSPQGEAKSSSSSSSSSTMNDSESHHSPGALHHPAHSQTASSLSVGTSSQRDRGSTCLALQEKGGREGESQALRNQASTASHGGSGAASRNNNSSSSSGALAKTSSSSSLKTITAGTRGGSLHGASQHSSKKEELASLGTAGERRRTGEPPGEEKRGEKGSLEKESPRRKMIVSNPLRNASLSSSSSSASGEENLKNSGRIAGDQGDREGQMDLLLSSTAGNGSSHRKRAAEEEAFSSSSLPSHHEESHRGGGPSLSSSSSSSPDVCNASSPPQGSSKRMKVSSPQGRVEKHSTKKETLGSGGGSAATIGEGREGGKGDGSISRVSGVHTPGLITMTTTRGGMCTRNQLASSISTRSSSSSQVCSDTSSSLSSSLPSSNSSSLLSHTESSPLSSSQATRARNHHLEGTSLASSFTPPEEKGVESVPRESFSSSSCHSSRVSTKGKVNTRRTTAAPAAAAAVVSSSPSPRHLLSTSPRRTPAAAAAEDMPGIISGVSGASSVHTAETEGEEGGKEDAAAHSREGGRGLSCHHHQGIPLNVKKSEISFSPSLALSSSASGIAASSSSSSSSRGVLISGRGEGEKTRSEDNSLTGETLLNIQNVSIEGEMETTNASRRLRSGRVLRSSRHTDEETKSFPSSSSSSSIMMSSSSQGLPLSSSSPSAVGGEPRSSSSSFSSSV